MAWSRIVMICLLAAAVGGCWFNGSTPKASVGSEAFYRPAPGTDDPRRHLPDPPPSVMYNQVRVDLLEKDKRRQPTAQSVTALSPAVREAVTMPAGPIAPPQASITPSTATAKAAPSPAYPGSQYMTLGAVVTEVSGTPIYADKVIQVLSPLLSSQARQMDAASFKALAQREIEKQVGVMIRTELEYAAAVQNLGADEKTFAENLTTAWRQRQITEAGGSLELARRKALADGIDFDEKVHEQYRTYMVQIFYQKKVYPKVQVTAEDMRRYYDQHLKSEFTESGQAQFRLIKISAKNMGGRAEAIDKIKDLHDRAARGEDFEKLAGSINHDPGLMKSAGRVGGADGWVQRGAFAISKVEDAVWTLQPGQVSEAIEIGDSFYIAKLENRKPGRVRSFEEEDVQKQISETLRKAQISARREQMQAKLMADAVIYPYPPVLDAVLEIAMQRYTQWAMAK